MIDATLARLAVSLSMDAADFTTGSTSVQKEMSRLAGAVQGLGDKWMQAGKRLSIGVSAPLVAFGVLSAKTASDAQELESAFGQTFGELTDSMTDWAQTTGDAMGRSTQSMQQMANTFGIFFNQAAPTNEIAADMSKTFTVLAQDLSSFFNVSESDALAKLRSGLSGESEPLRDFGVFLNEATVKAKGLEMGLGGLTGELSEQEKILARYELILASTSDAQGDVLRTSDDAANQARAFSGAMEELQVVIGKKLLPLLTPLIEGATKVLNAFTNLPAPIQNVIIGVGALAAAMGPLMLITGTLAATLLPLFAARFGPIGLAISAFINPLGTAVSLIAQFALSLGGLTILKTIGAIVLRFLGPIGLLVTAGILIYKNWDRISAVFEEFWKTAQATLGPPLQELMATLTQIFDELMSGPLGDGIRSAMAFIKEFGALAVEIFGDAVVGVLRIALDVVIEVFKGIADAIRLVNNLLNGDFNAAIASAIAVVSRMPGPFGQLAAIAIDAMRRLYLGVKQWLDKLTPVFNWVGDRTKQVSGFFRDMYIAVVGNSFVPDMVDGIAAEMARLDAVMVNPARAAAKSTTDTMREMAREVSSILNRLFPEVEKARKLAEERATLAASDLPEDLKALAQFRLGTEGLGKATVSEGLLNTKPLIDASEQASKAIDGLEDSAQIKTVRIAQTFADMAQNVTSSLQQLANGIRSGGFLDVLGAVVNIGLQLGGAGLFGKGIQTSLNSPIPGNAQGTNNWRGGLSWVGERGPELVNMPRGSQVISNRNLRAANDRGGNVNITVGVDPRNGNITAFTDNRIIASAPAVANAGAMQAQALSRRSASRRVR